MPLFTDCTNVRLPSPIPGVAPRDARPMRGFHAALIRRPSAVLISLRFSTVVTRIRFSLLPFSPTLLHPWSRPVQCPAYARLPCRLKRRFSNVDARRRQTTSNSATDAPLLIPDRLSPLTPCAGIQNHTFANMASYSIQSSTTINQYRLKSFSEKLFRLID